MDMDSGVAADLFLEQTALLPMAIAAAAAAAGNEDPFTAVVHEKMKVPPHLTSIKVVITAFIGFWLIFLLYCGACRMARITSRSRGFVMNLCQVLTSETQAVIAAVAGLKIVFSTWSDLLMATSTLTNW